MITKERSAALEDAVELLDQARARIEGAAPLPGALDLLATGHVAAASAMLRMLVKTHGEGTRAAAAGA